MGKRTLRGTGNGWLVSETLPEVSFPGATLPTHLGLSFGRQGKTERTTIILLVLTKTHPYGLLLREPFLLFSFPLVGHDSKQGEPYFWISACLASI